MTIDKTHQMNGSELTVRIDGGISFNFKITDIMDDPPHEM